MKILTNKVFKEYTDCWLIAQRVHQCNRWFSEWGFLEPMWDYIFHRTGTPADIGEAREKTRKLYELELKKIHNKYR